MHPKSRRPETERERQRRWWREWLAVEKAWGIPAPDRPDNVRVVMEGALEVAGPEWFDHPALKAKPTEEEQALAAEWVVWGEDRRYGHIRALVASTMAGAADRPSGEQVVEAIRGTPDEWDHRTKAWVRHVLNEAGCKDGDEALMIEIEAGWSTEEMAHVCRVCCVDNPKVTGALNGRALAAWGLPGSGG